LYGLDGITKMKMKIPGDDKSDSPVGWAGFPP